MTLTEGERWSRDALRELAERRYSPAAIGAFLVASHRRANAAARSRPELVRQASGWFAVGLAPWAVVASQSDLRRAAAGVCWWSACGAMLYWHLGMIETIDGRPRPLSGADALTLTRAWLVPVVWAQPSAAACALGALTDALDGVVARRGAPTRAGRDLEGLVDTCLWLAALRGSARADLLAPAAVAAEGLRLGVGLSYASACYFRGLSAPRPAVLRAGRAFTPARVAAMVIGARGHRRTASVLLGAGALAAVTRAARSLTAARHRPVGVG